MRTMSLRDGDAVLMSADRENLAGQWTAGQGQRWGSKSKRRAAARIRKQRRAIARRKGR